MTHPRMNIFNVSKMLKNWNKAIKKSQRVRATGISLRMHYPWKTPSLYKQGIFFTPKHKQTKEEPNERRTQKISRERKFMSGLAYDTNLNEACFSRAL